MAAASRYLSNARYSGNSESAWHFLADPADLLVIKLAFLNGQENPTIETVDADFNVLGIQMRGYHDFGVALQNPSAPRVELPFICPRGADWGACSRQVIASKWLTKKLRSGHPLSKLSRIKVLGEKRENPTNLSSMGAGPS